MSYPLVLDLAADRSPVTVTCPVLGFSTQAFYAWRSSPISQRDWDDAHLTNAALDIHHDDPAFGYRFSPSRAWPSVRTGSRGCARSSGSGRCTPRNAG